MAEKNPPRRCDFSGALRLGSSGRLLRRAEPRPADLAHGEVFLAARRIRLPEAHEHYRRVTQGRAKTRQACDGAGPGRRISGARAFGRAQIGKHAQRQAVSAGPEKIIRDEIRALTAYHVQSSEGMEKLDAMENPYRLPESLRREIAEVVANAEINRYPDPTAPALMKRLRNVMGIGPEYDVLLGNGSDEIIHIIVQSVARPGAVVLAPRPCFFMFSHYAQLAGLRYVGVLLNPDFTLDTGAFLGALAEHRPAVVFIDYPNNPSGNLFSDKAIVRIIAAAPWLVVIDEAYHPFAGRTFMTRLQEFPNLMVMRTLSKLGLPGIRLGYAVGRPEWIREFDRVRPPYTVNMLTHLVAERVLAHHDVLDAQARSINAERERLDGELRKLPRVTVFPSKANFTLVRVPDAPGVFEGMRRRGVLVKNLHTGVPLLDHCVRLTIGTPEENRRCLAAFAEALAEH